MVAHAYHPTMWEDKAGKSQVQGQSGQLSEFYSSLNYTVRPCPTDIIDNLGI